MVKVFFKGKDGGIDSKVYGYWLFESKRFGSIVLLNFKRGSREVYHTHAFNSISWVLWGKLKEYLLDYTCNWYRPSLKPVLTYRDTFHKVSGLAENTWVLSFRGNWVDKWLEYIPSSGKTVILTNGRKQI